MAIRLNTRRIRPHSFPRVFKKGKTIEFTSAIPYRKLSLSLVLINIAIITLVYNLTYYLPPEIPLYYGAAEGVDQLASSNMLILPGFISLLIILTNLTLSVLINSDFIKKALILGAVVATFFSTITIIKIFFLIGSF